jgi:hypothetical protein
LGEAGGQTHLGSALGFSQPLSGFQANTSSTALFHAATVTELFAPESSPREDRVPLSRPLASLRLFPAGLKCVARGLIAARFTDSHAFGAVAWLPPATMSALSTDRSLLPGCPGPPAAGSLPATRFTRFEAFLPSRIRSHRLELPQARGRYSPAYSPPLKTLDPEPRNLNPPSPEEPNTTVHPKATVRDTKDRRPLAPGETSPTSEDPGSASSAVTTP